MTNYLIKIKLALLEAPIMVLIYFFYFGCENFSKGVPGGVCVCVQGGACIPVRVCVCACIWVRGCVW